MGHSHYTIEQIKLRTNAAVKLMERVKGLEWPDMERTNPGLFINRRAFNTFMAAFRDANDNIKVKVIGCGIHIYFLRRNLYLECSKIWDGHSVLKRMAVDVLNTSSPA